MNDITWISKDNGEKFQNSVDLYLISKDSRFEIYTAYSLHGQMGFEIVDHVGMSMKIYPSVDECMQHANTIVQS